MEDCHSIVLVVKALVGTGKCTIDVLSVDHESKALAEGSGG